MVDTSARYSLFLSIFSIFVTVRYCSISIFQLLETTDNALYYITANVYKYQYK